MCPNLSFRLRVLAGALLLAASCATTPKPSAETARAKDTAPEKVAAHRAAAPHGLPLEQDEERWGFDAARERRRQQDAAKARQQNAADAGKSVDVTPAGR
jgi:hypothetical protein